MDVRFLTLLFHICAFYLLHRQILGPFEEQEEFTVEDFQLLEKITLSTSAEKVKAKVKQMGMKAKQYVSYFLCMLCFLLPLTSLVVVITPLNK